MKNSKEALPSVTLVGDVEENFYQLGLKDKSSYKSTYDHLGQFILGSNKVLNAVADSSVQVLAKLILSNNPEFKLRMQAYAEGLGVNSSQIASRLILPELFSSLEKWLPGTTKTIWGCSSAFALNHKNELVHSRVLDFPLVGSFDRHQRVLRTRFRGRNQIWSLGSAGFPYPVLTATNEKGITLALHQKFSSAFDKKGTPIFEIAFDLLQNCSDKSSILKFLKQSRSLTTWGLIIGLRDGEVLNLDICGDQIQRQEFQLRAGEILYFNNQPLTAGPHRPTCTPLGMTNYCQMRHESAQAKISLLKKKKTPLKDIDLLKLLARPKIKKAKTALNWTIDTVTPSSLHVVTMNPSAEQIHLTHDHAPAYLNQDLIKIERYWGEHLISEIKSGLSPLPENYLKGMAEVAKTVSFLEFGKDHQAHHAIQLATHYLSDYPDGKLAQFFHAGLQYVSLDRNTDLANLHKRFVGLAKILPEHFKQHCYLFIARLERILGLQNSIQPKKFKLEEYQELFELEQKLPLPVLKLTRHLIKPRFDIYDFIYLYYKPSAGSLGELIGQTIELVGRIRT